jgi:hypothetical protein
MAHPPLDKNAAKLRASVRYSTGNRCQLPESPATSIRRCELRGYQKHRRIDLPEAVWRESWNCCAASVQRVKASNGLIFPGPDGKRIDPEYVDESSSGLNKTTNQPLDRDRARNYHRTGNSVRLAVGLTQWVHPTPHGRASALRAQMLMPEAESLGLRIRDV